MFCHFLCPNRPPTGHVDIVVVGRQTCFDKNQIETLSPPTTELFSFLVFITLICFPYWIGCVGSRENERGGERREKGTEGFNLCMKSIRCSWILCSRFIYCISFNSNFFYFVYSMFNNSMFVIWKVKSLLHGFNLHFSSSYNKKWDDNIEYYEVNFGNKTHYIEKIMQINTITEFIAFVRIARTPAWWVDCPNNWRG